MRTTLTLDPSIYQLLKETASTNRESIGKTASRLIRQAVTSDTARAAPDSGFPCLPEPENPVMVTDRDVSEIRENLGV